MVVEQLWRNYMTILPSVFIRSAASALCMSLVGHCIFYSSWGLWNESRLMCAQVPWLLLVSAVCVCVRRDEAAWAPWEAGWWIRGGLHGQELMIDTQIGYEVLPANPLTLHPGHTNFRGVKQRSKKIQRALTGGEDGERGSEVRREWKSVERIGWVSPGEG